MKLELVKLIKPALELSNCVCCGEPGQAGRYAGLPVCFPCYHTGLLMEWLKQHEAENWPERESMKP